MTIKAVTSLKWDLICGGAVRKYHSDGREVCCDTPKGKLEYKRRTLAMRERQSGECWICNQLMPLNDCTFGHDIPRGNGGAFRDDRIVDDEGRWLNHAEHSLCNGNKGSRRTL